MRSLLFSGILIASLAVGTLEQAAASDSLQHEVNVPTFVEGGIFNQYRLLNINAADTTNADQLHTGGGLSLNLSGAGVTVGIWDGGHVLDTHQEFQSGGSSRVTIADAITPTYHPHSTHVAGTIGAQGTVASAKGMAPGVAIRSYDWFDDTTEMAADGVISISNHSYGYARGWAGSETTSVGTRSIWYGNRAISGTEDTGFGSYSDTSVTIDDVLFNNPNLLSVWSAGNDRIDSFSNPGGTNEYLAYFGTPPPLGFVSDESDGWYVVSTSVYSAPPADGNSGTGYDSLPNGGQTAKNTLVVGAISDHLTDPHDGSTISITSFSSFGGTDDGRLAPHVVGDGASLYSTLDTSNSAYGSYSGTSMSAPDVSGTAALLVEHHRNESGASPTSATLKGLLIHTATDAIGSGATIGPDYASGYGLVNAAEAATVITDAFVTPVETRENHLLELSLADGDTFNFTGMEAIGGEIKATLVWTDPAGTPQSGLDDPTSVLVNDLDIWLEDEFSTTYFPWTLDINNPSGAALQDQANHVDNVEQVFYDSATADSIWNLFVGHTGLLTGGSQNYSLLISGLTFADTTTSVDAVPEPSSLVLFFIAIGLGLAFRRRHPAVE